MAAVAYRKRNILILGPSGSGKSTIANKILGSRSFELNLLSKESFTRFHHVSMVKEIQSEQYELTIIEVNFSALSETNLKVYTKMFKDREIHLVLFVFKSGRFTFLDVKYKNAVMQSFNIDQLTKVSALIITHCEAYREDALTEIVTEYKESGLLKDIVPIFGKGTFTVGFPFLDNCDAKVHSIITDSMQKDQEKLDQLIRGLDTGVPYDDLFKKKLCTIM